MQLETDDLELATYLRTESVVMVSTYRARHRLWLVFDNADGRASRLSDVFYDSPEGKRVHDLIREYRRVRGIALDSREQVA